MARDFVDVIRIMRLAIRRRNENDPDSNDTTLLEYVNDFFNLEMANDTKLFENFGTLEFTIDETVTDGVYTFNDVAADNNFINIGLNGFISLTTQPTDSTSWNRLRIYQDPGLFFNRWGVNNEDILTAGYPTEMLFYGNQMTFRTIPDQSYDVTIYGYKKNDDITNTSTDIPYDYWLRYLAYGAARQYAADYGLSQETMGNIERNFRKEKNQLLKRTHNQRKLSRAMPRF